MLIMIYSNKVVKTKTKSSSFSYLIRKCVCVYMAGSSKAASHNWEDFRSLVNSSIAFTDVHFGDDLGVRMVDRLMIA